MASSGLRCRVYIVSLILFPLITNGQVHIEHKITGGYGGDTSNDHENAIHFDRNNSKVGIFPRYLTNETQRLTGHRQSWNEGKRDAGSEYIQDFSNHSILDVKVPSSGSSRDVGSESRKKDVFETKSRSSGGGKQLSPHDGERADDQVIKFIAEKNEMKGLDDQEMCGLTRSKRDIDSGDNSNEDKISDRMSHGFPTGITIIHPGRGGIVQVFDPELKPERDSSNRKQDMFMSFHPVVFDVRPQTVVRPTVHQRPVVFNQHPRFRFPQQAFRAPHLVNNGNVEMVETRRPTVVEFRRPQQHHTFVSGPHFNAFVNHSNFHRPREEESNRPWVGFQRRPEPPRQVEQVVFERPESHFQRPVQQNDNRNPWNAFMQLIHKNPKRPRFPEKNENSHFIRFPPTTEQPDHAMFNPVTGQQLITRLPVQTLVRPQPNFALTTNSHSRPLLTTPRPQEQQREIEQFFIPATDSSVLPFEFPSRFTESNLRPNEFEDQNDNRQNHFPQQFRPTHGPFHHTVKDDNRNFRPDLEEDERRFRPTERPRLTTPPKPKPIHRPVPLERPVTQRPFQHVTLTRPITNRPNFITSTTSITNDHSPFTHSFVPSTPTVHFGDEGFTRKPDPAIIPPRPPFLKENHSPMYFIPPLKFNRTSSSIPTTPEFTTLSPEKFNLKTSHSTDFPTRNTLNNQQTSIELTTWRDLQQSTASQVPVSHESQQSIDDEWTKHDFIEDTTWQSRPIDFKTTTQIPPTTESRRPTLRRPSFMDQDKSGISMNKFLTPFVEFKEHEETSQHSFVPNSAVKVTPKAIATPEFNPTLKPASQSHFTVSTTPESIIGEEFDSLMTPSRPDRNHDFKRTSTKASFFDEGSSSLALEDEDLNFNPETENSISFTTSFGPETNVMTTTGPSTQFHPIKGPGLRFPLHIKTSSKTPLISTNTFRPTTFRPPLNVDQFTQLDHGRTESDIDTPIVGSPASQCNADQCQLPFCFCGSNTRIPGDLSANEVPQLVLLTFDDDVNEVNWNVYKKILYTGRRNPNGCPIQATFYISHEWTDYSKVNTLYLDGHEIASHSISHPDGASYTKQQWKDEIQGQREILSFMGGVPIQQIQGMRAPFLAVGGNKMFGMLYESNFTYDSSLPVPIHDPPLWPYTLDYALGHDCMIPPCPRKSFPGVWEIPMIMWVDLKGGRCSMADACSWPDTKEKVFEQLVKNFQRHYKSNRAPFNLFFHSAWFDKPQNMEGFLLFMDRILTLPDVFFVTSMQAVEWMRQPTSVREIHSFVPFSCHLRHFHGTKCKKPRQCQLRFRSETRYVQSCQECPAIYPWIKNPFGKHL